MDNYFQQMTDANWWIWGIFFIDKIIFLLYLISVCYLFIFAIGSLKKRSKVYPMAKKQYRYAILFPIEDTGVTIIDSIQSFINQDYPKEKYDIIIVSNSLHGNINEKLSGEPVNLIIADIDNYNKIQAIRYAMHSIDVNMYDVVIIMDEDNTVDVDFIKTINNAYYSGGMAIQTHRMSKKLETDTALFGAVSEEINNSIFRRGHVNLGFSSALIGSGMVFNFPWFKKNIVNVTNADMEKQLEAMLLEQGVFIEYLNDTHVYEEKADKADEFYKQRDEWLTNRKHNMKIILHKFPVSLIQGNYDYCDKLFQWIMPSRIILIGTLIMIAVALLFISWGMALKWLFALLLLIVAFSIATPDYLIDTHFVKALRGAPLLFLLTVINSLEKKLLRKQ